MPNELDPIIDNWYFHMDKGQRFKVVATDENADTVELQHFDGDIEELSFNDWASMDIELSEEPEDWSGPLDVAEQDDLGTEVTDTVKKDWSASATEYSEPVLENLKQ